MSLLNIACTRIDLSVSRQFDAMR